MAELRAQAYVSCGMWVAKCPRPWCVNADHYGPGPNTGRIGGLTDTRFTCLYCGLVCDAVWPDFRDDIEHLLAQRPQPETRNWLPAETLDDLFVENAVHGLVDLEQLTAGMPLTLNGRLTRPARRLVAAAPAHAIGG